MNDVVLEDSFNPYWDGMYPTNMLTWKMDPETVWGPDEMQSIKRMQEAINRLGSSFTQNALLNAVVRIVLDQGALSPKERNKLSNLAAEIIEKSPGREFNYQVPPPLPDYIPQFMNQLINWTREKVGVAQSPAQKDLPSIVTGPVIEGLQMMIETPIRTAARRIEEFYQRIGQQLISRIFQFYTSDRILRQVGPDKSWVEFEYFRHQLIVNPKTRAPRSEEDLRKAFQDFYFAIEPGSSLAVARMQRSLMKFHLVEMGWLHPREILEESGILNPNEKLKEAQEARDGGLFAALEGRNGKQSTSLPNVGNLFQ